MSAGRRSSSTATATKSPIFTEGSRSSASWHERTLPLPLPDARSGLIQPQAPLRRGIALLIFAGFDLGQPAAPIPAAADERQRGERQQRGAHGEQRERDRTLEEDRPVAVRHDQRLAQRH